MTRAPILILGVLGISAVAAAFDAANFSADGMKKWPVPTGHTPGKDDYTLLRGTHNAGEDCGICHTPNGKAQNYVFTMAGTLYEDRFGSRPLVGAEVILQDVEGNIISMTTNVAGNFWTYSPIASNPKSVASHGGTTHELFHYDEHGALVPADSADSRTWQYKAWIKNGEQVIAMTTIAPVGGATGTSPRMACNMHHSPMGSTGAAWVSRKPLLAAYPETGLSFKKHVQPILTAKCAPCHVPGKRMTRLVTESDVSTTAPTSIDYSAGHDFTTYAGSSVTVGSGDAAETITKAGVVDAVDTVSPEMSPILTKTLIRPIDSPRVHPGGGFWEMSDADYRAVRQWIAEGALDN